MMEIPSSSHPVPLWTVRAVPEHSWVLSFCSEVVCTATVARFEVSPLIVWALWNVIERTELI